MGRQPTFPTGLRTELDCPTLSPGLLGHPRRRRWMFSTLRHHSLSLLQCTRRHNLLTQITSHRSALAPNSIHSEPFSPQPWSTCSNKPTSKQQQNALPQRSSENKTSHSAYQPHPVSRIGLNIFSQDKETLLDT